MQRRRRWPYVAGPRISCTRWLGGSWRFVSDIGASRETGGSEPGLRRSWEKAGLGYTQEESSHEKPFICLNNAHKRHDHTPAEQEDRDPHRGPDHLEDDVARHFETVFD